MLRLTPILSLTLTVTAIAASLWCTQSDWSNAEEPASAPSGDESVDVRLARAHAELARLDLRNALETNERIPNLFSADYIERLRLHVVNDEAQLEQTLKGEEADPHQICIRTAEAAVDFAEADLRRVRAAHERTPMAVTAQSVERASVVAEIAKLNLERAQHLDDTELVLTHLQWQIDELRHQLLELQMTTYTYR